ncbi:hypothetical protein B4U80_14558, partial [Leptotrombidium deliense]
KKEVIWIDIDPCDSAPCNLPVNTSYCNLLVARNSSTVLFTGTATFPDSQSYPIPSIDMCEQTPGLCPLKQHDIKTAVYSTELPGFVPQANNVVINAQFIGDEEAMLGCANFTVNITG